MSVYSTNSGFFKFENNCFRKHENQKCDNVQCEIPECILRHPKKCRYFIEYNNCKFGNYCKFDHDVIENGKVNEEMETLRKQVEEVKNRIIEKEQEIKLKDEKIKKLSMKLEERIAALEDKNKTIEKDLQEIMTENKYLRALIAGHCQAEHDGVFKIPNEVIDEEESEVENDDEEITEVLTDYEENCVEKANSYKCGKCDFIGKNGAGLKIHDTAKHKGKGKPLMQRFSRVTK